MLSARVERRVPQAVVRLTGALRHRGPDGEGFWADSPESNGRLAREQLPAAARLVLGHRRLSIVDLATGDQPIANEDDSVWVTFNGEIYNHLELRGLLERAGHRFATRADTEVLVHGWEEWGEGLLPRLNGIFAVALVDRRRGVTVLARDPVGVKPLYVGINNQLTWWASELGAARSAGLATEPVVPSALKLFLLFRFIPAPWAALEDTWKIPPGHYAVLHDARAGQPPEFRAYRTAMRSVAEPASASDWGEALIAELEQAVRRQLMSDVPVGSLLSGGVDSAMVTMLMDRHLPYHPHAFGIGFRSHGEASEALAGARAAEHLRVPFTPVWVEDAAYLDEWPQTFAAAGEPIGNSGGLLVYWLCRAVSRTHKVVLSGQGADEPLGGYPRHVVERVRPIGRFAPRASAWLADRLLGLGAGRRLLRVLGAVDRRDRYLEILAVLEPRLVDTLVPGGPPARDLGRAAIERWLPEHGSADELNDLLRVDARLSLADDLLMVADQFSMRASVELRVPFLDLQLLELIERMPSRYKVSRIGERKWLYRRTAARRLPADLAVTVRGLHAAWGRKWGFTAPIERWFGGNARLAREPREWVDPLITRGLLSPPAVSAFVAEAGRDGAPWQRELLALYALSCWVSAATTPASGPDA